MLAGMISLIIAERRIISFLTSLIVGVIRIHRLDHIVVVYKPSLHGNSTVFCITLIISIIPIWPCVWGRSAVFLSVLFFGPICDAIGYMPVTFQYTFHQP